MAYGTVNADVIGTSVANSNLGAGNASIMKNRIINGAMVIDQRNAGASVTISNTGAITYTLDRWAAYGNVASKFSVIQTLSATETDFATRRAAGFTNYLAVTSLSAYSVGASDQFSIQQPIEGLNIADLAWGTASAKTVTLSALVYSSLTGTFGGALRNSAANRSYPFSYSIPVANTWTQISVTIAGDTTGTWLTTNGVGINVLFGLGAGSTSSGTAGAWASASYITSTGAVSVVGTNGAQFFVTGVQLEVGSSATGFEYVNYQTSLANCQRYYQLTRAASGAPNTTTTVVLSIQPSVAMRAAPTISQNGVLYISDFITDQVQSSVSIVTYTSLADFACIGLNNFTGLALYRPYFLRGTNSNAITLSAEL